MITALQQGEADTNQLVVQAIPEVKSNRLDGWQKEGKLLAVGPLHCAPLHPSPRIQTSQNTPFEATGYTCYAQYDCFDDTDSNNSTLYMCNRLDGSLVQWFC